MGKYPIFLELSGRRVVVIGAGAIAIRKVQSLLAAGARVVVIANDVTKMIPFHHHKSNLEIVRSLYTKNHLAGATLVIAATNNKKINKRIFKDCQELEILCNVVDDPEHCDFFIPAVVKRGDLQIAISTEGTCPAYSGHIRKKLEKIFTEEHGRFLSELESLRNRILADVGDANDRKAILGRLVDDESFEFFVQNGPEAWKKRANKIIKE